MHVARVGPVAVLRSIIVAATELRVVVLDPHGCGLVKDVDVVFWWLRQVDTARVLPPPPPGKWPCGRPRRIRIVLSPVCAAA